MRFIVFAILGSMLYAGQVFAQKLPMHEWITIQARICGTGEAAREVATTITEKGFAEAEPVFEKNGCVDATAVVQLTKLVDSFFTPNGSLKMVEALVVTREKIYILTMGELEGVEEA